MALRDPEAGASPLALFGAELRHYRTAAGLSQEQLGDRIGYSAALVGAVETARRMPTEDFTARCDVVEELGTGGALLRLRAHLRDQLHRQVWPPWFREWPSIEREALSLRTWELAGVPGLLQTADYARAILRGHCLMPPMRNRTAGRRPNGSASRSWDGRTRRCCGRSWTRGRCGARLVLHGRCGANSGISSTRPRIPRSRYWSCRPRRELT